MKPANQLGSLRRKFLFFTIGIATLTTSGKAYFSTSDKPQFIEALFATILRNPFSVKCS